MITSCELIGPQLDFHYVDLKIKMFFQILNRLKISPLNRKYNVVSLLNYIAITNPHKATYSLKNEIELSV